jgi:hypothetical protein
MEYYEIFADDKNFGNRWFLGEPHDSSGQEIDARLFRYGVPYIGLPPKTVPIDHAGTEVALNLGAFDMPVVRDDVRKAIASVTTDGYELYPVEISGLGSRYWILNVSTRVDCVDEAASIFRKWLPEDERPDRLGAYRSLSILKIDSQRVHNHIFRLKGWEIAVIVSDPIRKALMKINDLGVVFSKA